MAILERQASGIFRTRIFFAGEQRTLSLRTRDEKTARGLLKGIENAIWRLKTGNADLPAGANAWDWVTAGGKIAVKPTRGHTFSELVEHYRQSLPEGSKAASTRQSEDIHVRHLQRIMGKNLPLSRLNTEAVQDYVTKRSKQTWRGKRISGATVRKELRTLSVLWSYADALGWVSDKKPTRGVLVGRPHAKEPFRTLAEIKRLVKEVSADRLAELWEACFLDQKELKEFLAHCRERPTAPWFFPAVASCAYAGLRRSEWMRSRIEDWDFARSSLTVREKKRSHSNQGSTRVVEIHPQLKVIVQAYLRAHVGGSLLFVQEPDVAITMHQAVDRWKDVTRRTAWSGLKGYHVLRHSFCSNLAAAGVSPAIIDKWVGHQTIEQRERYRHLHPAERGGAIAKLKF